MPRKGVEAQTVANVHLAMKQGLTIIPVINKIDLPNADLPSVRRQLEEILAIPCGGSHLRQREGRHRHRGHPRSGRYTDAAAQGLRRREGDRTVRGLVFDSVFDIYRGVVSYVRMFSGRVEPGTPDPYAQHGQ